MLGNIFGMELSEGKHRFSFSSLGAFTFIICLISETIELGKQIWAFLFSSLGNVYGKFMKRYGQKLRRIILLRFGLITFRFGYGRDRKPFIFMISGFLDVAISPKTIYFHLDTRRPQIIQEKTQRSFWKY